MGDTQLSTPRTDDLQMLTILMPAHNEEQIIAAAVMEWHTEVISRLPGAWLLVIDDASTDGTAQELSRLADTLPRMSFIRRPVNGGHGQALLTGFRQIDTEFIFQTDSDRQHRPKDFWRLWELRGQCDFVFGVRSKRQDGVFRRVVATLMRVLIWVLWQVWVTDANCPFKLMRNRALASVLRRIPEEAFIPMVMVAILARRLRYRVAEVSVQHLPRRGGTQSLHGLGRWWRVAWRCACQLTRLRLRE